ncbi:hypothetical protein KIN20_000645 [Parelaphostrongylus tenuis]|uniref:SCP domain-containing protein n=1 Tax=Parelaphostrongylus tenuis TaxID=148309 RepID=A0AAD5MKY5_PARTN|nr:hypothetical protein KIN20_000645 [Parelaphostrongylus tenuis]
MPFGCQEINTGDETRQGVLNLINRIRSRVALGEFEGKNHFPSASDMQAMRWDCNLETIANISVTDCAEDSPPAAAMYGMNYQFFKSGTPDFTLKHSMESAVLHWADIKNANWQANNIFSENPTLRSFANLIRATTNAVGCASRMCNGRAAAACVFSQPDVQPGTPLYTPGNPCRKDEDCVAFSPAYCESGLCVNASRKTTTVMATTTPDEPRTQTSDGWRTETPSERRTTASHEPWTETSDGRTETPSERRTTTSNESWTQTSDGRTETPSERRTTTSDEPWTETSDGRTETSSERRTTTPDEPWTETSDGRTTTSNEPWTETSDGRTETPSERRTTTSDEPWTETSDGRTETPSERRTTTPDEPWTETSSEGRTTTSDEPWTETSDGRTETPSERQTTTSDEPWTETSDGRTETPSERQDNNIG